MFDINVWLEEFLFALNENFGQRVWFAGLQGSRGRGEATENSDIDIVVILDNFTASDVQTYNTMLNGLSHRELICGFISGKDELLNWEASDLFQFYHDTKPLIGSLDGLLPLLDEKAVNRAIKIGACNIYHGCVHNMLHEKSDEILKALYKSASFVAQAICFKQTGNYVSRQKDLLQMLDPTERQIVEISLALKQGCAVDFQQMSESLFVWSQAWINKS